MEKSFEEKTASKDALRQLLFQNSGEKQQAIHFNDTLLVGVNHLPIILEQLSNRPLGNLLVLGPVSQELFQNICLEEVSNCIRKKIVFLSQNGSIPPEKILKTLGATALSVDAFLAEDSPEWQGIQF